MMITPELILTFALGIIAGVMFTRNTINQRIKMALLDDANAALSALETQVARNGSFLAIPHPSDAIVTTLIGRTTAATTKLQTDLDNAGADPAPVTPPPTPTPTPTP